MIEIQCPAGCDCTSCRWLAVADRLAVHLRAGATLVAAAAAVGVNPGTLGMVLSHGRTLQRRPGALRRWQATLADRVDRARAAGAIVRASARLEQAR